jgi:hypothetical protein
VQRSSVLTTIALSESTSNVNLSLCTPRNIFIWVLVRDGLLRPGRGHHGCFGHHAGGCFKLFGAAVARFPTDSEPPSSSSPATLAFSWVDSDSPADVRVRSSLDVPSESESPACSHGNVTITGKQGDGLIRFPSAGALLSPGERSEERPPAPPWSRDGLPGGSP